MALPAHFDLNEWFIVVSLLILYPVMLSLPKRFPHAITIFMFFFSLTYSQLVDHLLAGKFLNLYDINDKPKYELMDFIGWFIYPPFGYFFVYLYDKWNIKGLYTLLYLMAWTVLSICIERITVMVRFFKFNHWNSWDSIPVYLGTLSIYLLVFISSKKYFAKIKVESGKNLI